MELWPASRHLGCAGQELGWLVVECCDLDGCNGRARGVVRQAESVEASVGASSGTDGTSSWHLGSATAHGVANLFIEDQK